jgi:hypothetical protein
VTTERVQAMRGDSSTIRAASMNAGREGCVMGQLYECGRIDPRAQSRRPRK